MVKVSTPSQYPLCTDTGFIADSWIPSVSLGAVPCVGATHNANGALCPDTASL